MANSAVKKVPLSFNRQMVIASVSVSGKSDTIHSLMEVDITEPQRIIEALRERIGEKPSFTAFIVASLAWVLRDHPQLNAFIKGRKLVILPDVTVNVLIERDIEGEKVPESLGIEKAQAKSYRQIHREIREAQNRKEGSLGSLSGMTWIRFIPRFLLRWFMRLANTNIGMAKRYGKVAVTAVGMYHRNASWYIPPGSATVQLTVGGIHDKVVMTDDGFAVRKHLCLTASFDHHVVDGAPAARFVKQLAEVLKNGKVLEEDDRR